MIVVLCFVLPLCIFFLLPVAWLEEGGSRKGLLLVVPCAFLLAYGLFAFFGQGGGFSVVVGDSVELPVVSTAGAVENDQGQRFVPLEASERIQVYDRTGNFVRGWFVPASGGAFKLHVNQNDNLDVFTARGDRHLVYAPDGKLLEGGQSNEAWDQLPTGPACGVDRMAPWYLWPLGSPFLAMLPGIAGFGGIVVLFTRKQSVQQRVQMRLAAHSSSIMHPSSRDLGQSSAGIRRAKAARRSSYDAVSPEYLANPPAGAWCKQEPDGFSVGVSARNPTVFLLVPFLCLWSTPVVGIYVSQVLSWDFDPIVSLLGIFFLVIGAYFWVHALMCMFGKIIVTIQGDNGTVFEGVGPLGRRRSFDWSDINAIRAEGDDTWPGSCVGGISLDGAKRLTFGRDVSKKRKTFMLRVLKFWKETSDAAPRRSRGVVSSNPLENPPSGAWFAEEPRGFSLGASTRSPLAFFVVPWTCAWSFGVLATFYRVQVDLGRFDISTCLVWFAMSAPLVSLCLVFAVWALRLVCGKIVVTVDDGNGTVFVGIGRFGWKRSFDWSGIDVIREEGPTRDSSKQIVMEGDKCLKFGCALNEKRRYFMLSALRHLKHKNN